MTTYVNRTVDVETSFSSEYSSSDSYSCTSPSSDPYQVLSSEDLQESLERDVAQVKSTLSPRNMCSTEARVLLDECNWSFVVLVERIAEGHVTFASKPDLPPEGVRYEVSDAKLFYCAVCCTTRSTTKMAVLGCGHVYCVGCVQSYVESRTERRQKEIYCLSDSCSSLISDRVVQMLVDEKVFEAHRRLILDSYVLKNSALSWCPGPNCTRAFKIDKYAASNVSVKCDTCDVTMCFGCKGEAHQPLDCGMLKAWLDYRTSDDLNELWFRAHVKKCPGCELPITKGHGCNHMTCIACGHQFCWACFDAWKGHGSGCSYKDEIERADSKLELERYEFYQGRYDEQERKLKQEKRLLENISCKPFLIKKAKELLRDCRLYLKHTYAFTFFLERNNSSAIFELQQKSLHEGLVDLAEFMEKVDADDVTNNYRVRSELSEKLKYCAKRKKVLIASVDEGYEQETWKFYQF